MIDIDRLYFKWLMSRIEPTQPLERLCLMLHQNVFQRRVGNDVNRAVNGAALRNFFMDDYDEARIDPRVSNDFMALECTWLEMLMALSDALDFQYDGGVKERLLELVSNMGLLQVLFSTIDKNGCSVLDGVDQDLVDLVVSHIDHNQFDADGHGGLFPLETDDHPDQREVEIWEQSAAYFRERLKGVIWTSTN